MERRRCQALYFDSAEEACLPAELKGSGTFAGGISFLHPGQKEGTIAGTPRARRESFGGVWEIPGACQGWEIRYNVWFWRRWKWHGRSLGMMLWQNLPPDCKNEAHVVCPLLLVQRS